MSMKYLVESLHQAVLSEGKASIALRQVAKDFGASSAASQITDDNVRDVSIKMVDNLVRHSLKMAMRQPASKVAAFNPSAMLGRIRAIAPVTDVGTAFSASKILSKTVERASEEGGGTPEVAAVEASVNALRSLRAMLRKNPDAATASINALSSDIATAATAIGAASKSPRHVKLAVVSAITGEPLPSEENEEGTAPQMEAVAMPDLRGLWDALSKANDAYESVVWRMGERNKPHHPKYSTQKSISLRSELKKASADLDAAERAYADARREMLQTT